MTGFVSLFFFAASAACFAIYVATQLKSNKDFVIQLVKFVDSLDDATDLNTKINRYLLNSYKPVAQENYNIATDVISGAIPEDLSGLFLRIGPNPKPNSVHKRYHWFDGDGMIHSLRIRAPDTSSDEGQVSSPAAVYSNQWVRTPRFNIEEQLNQAVFLRLGELRGLIGLLKVLLVAPLIDNVFGISKVTAGTANTAMMMFDSKLYACHEGSLPFQIQWTDNNSFLSVGYETLGGVLDSPVTAHSRVDPVDGGWYFNGYDLADNGPNSGMKFGSTHPSLLRDSEKSSGGSSNNDDNDNNNNNNNNNTLRAYFSIPSPVKSFAHDMMITENYVLFFESSVIFDTSGIMEGKFFTFSPQHVMRIGVMPKTGTSREDVTWFEADKAYSIIHGMNAWEVPSSSSSSSSSSSAKEIILFAHIGLDFDALNPEDATEDNEFFLAEIKLQLSDDSDQRTLSVHMLDTEILTEFPNIHPSFLGRPTQFGYSGRFFASGDGFSQLVKWDLFERKAVALVQLPDGLTCGEPVAIPKRTEDGDELSSEAVYLGVMAHNSHTNEGEWLLYDGTTMSSEPVVRLRLGGVRVPNGFHGMWISEDRLQEHLQAASSL